MSETAILTLGADTRGLDKGVASLDDVVIAGGKAEKATDKAGDAFKKAGNSATTAKTGLMGMARALGAVSGALAGAFSVAGAIKAAEQYSKMTNGLKAMGATSEQAAKQLQSITDIAMRTRAPLDATAQLYTRISIASAELGASQKDVLKFTENVGLALGSAGIGANEASGALMQLSQAMAGGTVRAEEFNSILENAFPLAQAAARGIDEAGGSVGRLRQLVVDGKVSSEEFFNAILSQGEVLAATFAQTEITIGQAMTNLGTAFTSIIGQLDQTMGVTSSLAQAIDLVAQNLDRIAVYAAVAAGVFAVVWAPAILAAALAAGKLVAALILTRAALIRTGIGLAVVALGELVYQITRAVDKVGGFGNAMRLLKDVAVEVWQRIADGANVIELRIREVSARMSGAFMGALGTMQAGWATFLRAIAGGFGNIPGMGGISDSLKLAAIDAQSGVYALDQLSSAASETAANWGSQADALTNAISRPLESVQALKDAISSNGEVTEDGASAADRLNNSLNETGGGAKGGAAGKAATEIEKLKTETEAFNDAMNDAAMTAEDFGKAKADILISGVDGVANAFGDFVAGGLKDFGGFVKSIINSFKQMLSQMIAMAVKNKIMIGLGFSGGGVGAAGAALAGGGGAGGVAGAAGNLGILGQIGGIGSALVGGFTNTIGALGGGIGNMFGAIGGQVSAALGGSATAIAGAVGAIAVPLLAVAAIFSFFSKKTKELDAGLQVTVDGMDALVQTFSVIETKRFWGLSKKVRTHLTNASDEVADPIIKAIGEMQGGIVDAAKTVGIADTVFNGFAHTLKVSTKGLSDADAQKAVMEAFEGMGDAFADMIPGLKALQKDGEGSTAAISRLSASLVAVNDVFDLLGHSMYAATLAGADLASTLVEAFGGLDAMTAAVGSYWQNFYSEEERLAISTRRLTEVMEGLGVTLPTSRQAFRDLVESMDTSTKEGATLYAQIMSLSGAFADITAPIETAAQAIKDFVKSILDDMDLMPTSKNQFDARGNIRLDDALAAAQSGDMEATRKYLADIRKASGSDLAYRETAAKVLAQFGAGVPAFAAGGMHTGGLRLVGENGPEIEATGPSRIYSNSQSKGLLDNSEMVAELRGLRSEVASLRDENRQLGMRADRQRKATADTLEKWDRSGLPMERTV